MKKDDRVEVSIWLNGEETEEHLRRWKTEQVPMLFQRAAQDNNVVISEPAFTILYPGQDRVPPVPDHIRGIDVRLLLAEATVLSERPVALKAQPGFVYDLTTEDLARLRKITRTALRKEHPGMTFNNFQVDAVIEYLGPDVAVKTLRNER